MRFIGLRDFDAREFAHVIEVEDVQPVVEIDHRYVPQALSQTYSSK